MPWWDTTEQDWFSQASQFNVSTWPKPNGPRIDARFKFVGGTPACASRASRHTLTWQPFPGGTRFYALIDVLPTDDAFVLLGETGEDPNGRNVEFSITDYQIGNPHPEYSETGIEYKFKLSLPGRTDWQCEWFFPDNPGIGEEKAPVSIRKESQNPTRSRNRHDACTAESAWESPDCFPVNWYTFTECVQPTGEEMVFSQNFARFNGIDSYIALSADLPRWNLPFVVECDVRVQSVAPWDPIFGKEAEGGFWGMDLAQFIWGSISAPSTWVRVVNKWVHMEFTFEQPDQLKYEWYIDGGLVTSLIASRQFSNANNLGVYRHSLAGVLWGEFDLKHLIYRQGTPGSFNTALDMPLQVNALDVGPFANHGTTFNMELPSV